MKFSELRNEYHRRICQEIIRFRKSGEKTYPNFADGGSSSSRAIALGIVNRLDCIPNYEKMAGQTAGRLFEAITKGFLERSFSLLYHLRPGKWHYSTQTPISEFDQYKHLGDLERIVRQTDELASSLGTDYIIKPDIVIARWPVADFEVNQEGEIVDVADVIAELTPLREVNYDPSRLILHASISCNWPLRSDRAQNARAEALNLVRNRKGGLPHVVAVTAEPLPTRIAALALGTGDMDCVYHFALPELQGAISEIDNEDQMDMLETLVKGRRLRDISDLPFDLAI